MQTRKDQVQAYQFAMGRLATALVSGNPGGGDSPTRRASLGTFFGAAIVVLLCIGFGVYGLISPVAKTSWKTPGAVVVEKENGNRFMYVGGVLHPVRNLASALLIAGRGAASPQSVSAKSLAGTRIGSPVGIPDAPDAVPDPATLLGGAWTRCLRPGLPGGQVVDFAPGSNTSALPDDRQVLLSGAKDARYVLWHGAKYRVGDAAVLIALGMDDEQALPAPQDWLAALPDGPALAAPKIDGAGQAAGQVAGKSAAVGDLFTTGGTGGSAHFYVMLSDGLAPVTATESALMSAASGATKPRTVTAADVAVAQVSKDRTMMHRLPDLLDMPAASAKGSAVCLRQESSGKDLRTGVVLERGRAATGSTRVLLPAGSGLVALDQAQVGRQGVVPRQFLITEDGTEYAIGDDHASAALGYGAGNGLPLPEDVLALLPRGPVLSQAAAVATVQRG
ncbi:type VII secretion protein EccB [Streptomyces fuscigenes]|uniref:type VII secretion protein EccB n=1 Tax=Streptomyces fuscigenes TaxID=1528880 RepID=UPI001F26F32F|nr:type VII secretion protein EccB [Streptomyces fuscigenes]MCF3962429.1 type VII secretion protein EccB [Streptomyces fuscigenes]